MKLEFIKLDENAKLPTRKHKADAGVDVYALETVRIAANSQKAINTGIGLANCPNAYVLFVWPKSGLDTRYALHTGAGVIDSTYRGEILILLKNMSEFMWEIEAGDAIAQLVLVACPEYEIVEAQEVKTTDRGADAGIARSNDEAKKT